MKQKRVIRVNVAMLLVLVGYMMGVLAAICAFGGGPL